MCSSDLRTDSRAAQSACISDAADHGAQHGATSGEDRDLTDVFADSGTLLHCVLAIGDLLAAGVTFDGPPVWGVRDSWSVTDAEGHIGEVTSAVWSPRLASSIRAVGSLPRLLRPASKSASTLAARVTSVRTGSKASSWAST